MPGKIIQSLRKAGTNNPVFMLDEMDKLGVGFHGDPSAALLEVLDPEQNSTFADHYLDVPFDLSKVFFVATANVLDTIPGPLRDRMEIIELPGYTQDEKLAIATRYLVARQLKANGLTEAQASISEAALRAVIDGYTREAGVRNLEREIGALLRHAAMKIAEGVAERVDDRRGRRATRSSAPRHFDNEVKLRTSVPGVATGLAWTPVGGDILFIEATLVPGKGQLILTGQLGDVMKESAQAAVSLAKMRLDKLGADRSVLETHDLHIHLPAGAIPKDGPSAGVAMFLAVASLLSGRTVRNDIAMTGEISLRGLVLPIGGIKEKALAALRAGIDTVLLPKRNEKDLEDIPEPARKQLKFVFLENIDDALAAAFDPPPERDESERRAVAANAAGFPRQAPVGENAAHRSELRLLPPHSRNARPSLDDVARDKLAALERRQLRRRLAVTARPDATAALQSDAELVSFSCNDYLGLSHHPDVVAASIDATRRFGVGAGSSRLVNGNHPLYVELERKLAALKGAEDAVVFGSGYLTNVGVIPALVGRSDLISLGRALP